MNTFFKSHDNTQFFNYDHLSGIMLTVVQDGCHQGFFKRCDKSSLVLVRQYSKEMQQGLHESVRTYHPSTEHEFNYELRITQESFNKLNKQWL
jgi:hypothetical protein